MIAVIDRRRIVNAPYGAKALSSTFTCTSGHFHTLRASSGFHLDLILPLSGSWKQPFKVEFLPTQMTELDIKRVFILILDCFQEFLSKTIQYVAQGQVIWEGFGLPLMRLNELKIANIDCVFLPLSHFSLYFILFSSVLEKSLLNEYPKGKKRLFKDTRNLLKTRIKAQNKRMHFLSRNKTILG